MVRIVPRITRSYPETVTYLLLHWPDQASLEPRRAAVDIVSDKNCEVVAGSKYTSSMVCAGGTKYNIEPCNGDQGGPLTCLVGGSHKLYGIISSVRSCGALFRGPEAYTRVTKFLRWIRDIIVNNKRLVWAVETVSSGWLTSLMVMLGWFFIRILIE